jgi:hypothetical protein
MQTYWFYKGKRLVGYGRGTTEQEAFQCAIRSAELIDRENLPYLRTYTEAKTYQDGLKKGDKGGECNRTACNAPNAQWFNKSTLKHYCTKCAQMIMQYPENKGLLTREN